MKRAALLTLVAVAFLNLILPLQGQPKTDLIVGTYAWFNESTVEIRENGGASCTFLDGKAVAGRWVVNPYGGYVIMWDGGFVDAVKLTPNGNRLEGSGLTPEGKVQTITGDRRKQ